MKFHFLAPFLLSASLSLIIAPFASATQLSEEQTGHLSMNCSSIKIQLKSLQKTDSKLRVYLGSKYEIVLSNFMTNLNLRLIKDDYADQELAGLQTTFSSERERFKADFTAYPSAGQYYEWGSQSEPQKFYDQLETVRLKRADVQASCDRMREVIDWHRTAVVRLQGSLAS